MPLPHPLLLLLPHAPGPGTPTTRIRPHPARPRFLSPTLPSSQAPSPTITTTTRQAASRELATRVVSKNKPTFSSLVSPPKQPSIKFLCFVFVFFLADMPQTVHEHTTTHLPRHTSPHHHQHSSAGHLGTTTKLAADLETPSGFCCCCRRAPPTGPSRHEHASADQGGLGEPDRTGGETVHYTAYHAAQDSRAGACLVAWPPTHHSYPTTPPTTARQSATATADDNLDHEQQTREERSEEAKTGSSYLTLEAALDARRGACFVAWPTDEEWRVPTLCV